MTYFISKNKDFFDFLLVPIDFPKQKDKRRAPWRAFEQASFFQMLA